MIDKIYPDIREFLTGVLPAGGTELLKFQGIKISESSLKKFVPYIGIDVLNQSNEDIKVFFNETDDKGYRVPANSNRPFSGVPFYDVTIKNLGLNQIDASLVSVVLYNDLEQTARYNAYAKERRY